MKKTILIVALAFSVFACNKSADVKEVKTAYIDTAKLMEEYTEAKDINEKYKAKSEEAGRKFEVAEANFKADADYFQKNAQANGQAWAQQKGSELQRRQQELQYAAQSMAQQIQMEHGREIDSLVTDVKKFIKDYGKKNGYAYIYGTGEANTILYAEDKYDITSEMVKLLNDRYKSPAKEEKTETAPEKK
jgi:outer membrane protein